MFYNNILRIENKLTYLVFNCNSGVNHHDQHDNHSVHHHINNDVDNTIENIDIKEVKIKEEKSEDIKEVTIEKPADTVMIAYLKKEGLTEVLAKKKDKKQVLKHLEILQFMFVFMSIFNDLSNIISVINISEDLIIVNKVNSIMNAISVKAKKLKQNKENTFKTVLEGTVKATIITLPNLDEQGKEKEINDTMKSLNFSSVFYLNINLFSEKNIENTVKLILLNNILYENKQIMSLFNMNLSVLLIFHITNTIVKDLLFICAAQEHKFTNHFFLDIFFDNMIHVIKLVNFKYNEKISLIFSKHYNDIQGLISLIKEDQKTYDNIIKLILDLKIYTKYIRYSEMFFIEDNKDYLLAIFVSLYVLQKQQVIRYNNN